MANTIKPYIRNIKYFNRTSFCVTTILLGLLALLFFPLVNRINNTEAIPVQSETTLALSTSDINMAFSADNPNGTFSSSDPANIVVNTNNYSGYTLNIATTTNDDTYNKLINTDNNEYYLNSISSASTESEFNIGNWGYLPSKLNGEVNTKYQPAPNLDGTILDITDTANNEPNNYTITLGAKVDYTTMVGTYNNVYRIQAVANTINYEITYDKNTEDDVDNMPSTQAGDVGNVDIMIASNTPTRAHYSFLGWCTVTPTTTNGVDSCEGTNATIYQPNDVYSTSQTTLNTLNLKAMWKIDTFTLTINKGSNISSATGDGTYNYGEQVTISATKTTDTTCVAYSTPAWSVTEGTSTLSSATGNSVTITIADDTTIAVSSTPSNISQTITLSRSGGASGITIGGTSYTGSSASLVCGNYSITGSYSSDYTFSSWSTSGSVSVASTSAASTTLTVNGSGTLALAGKISKIYIQNITTATCPTTRTLVYDSRDNKAYYIQKIGSLCWMTSNLAYASGATQLDATYGGYYNWNTAMSICPTNWKLPSKDVYDNLISTYSTGITLNAAPWYGQYGGSYSTKFNGYGTRGTYWTSTKALYDDTNTLSVGLKYNDSGAGTGYNYHRTNFSLSVRCIAN